MKMMIRFVSIWALVGFCVSLFWLLFWRLFENQLISNFKKMWLSLHILENITWPFSLLPTGDIISTSSRLILMSQLILGNAVFYSVLGTIAWFILKLKK